MTASDPRTEKVEARLKLLHAQLDGLAAKAEMAHADVKIEQQKRVAQLKEHLAAARTGFDELNAAGADKVEVLKEGFESAWKELNNAFKKASA